MIGSLFFLFGYLLLLVFAPYAHPLSIPQAWLFILGLYGLIALVIAAQNYAPLAQRRRYFLTQLELMLFAALAIFLFGAYKIFENLPFSETLFISLFLLFYFLALALIKNGKELMRFLFPFPLPLLFFLLFLEAWEYLSWPYSFVFLILLLFFFLFYFPPLFIAFWGSEPLEDSPLKQRLEKLCKQANFRYAGMRKWLLFPQMVTAGIIGIFPRFRYVLFTEKALEKLSEEELEAVLAHEIAHSAHYHLLFYPFIILGLPTLLALISPLIQLLIDAIAPFFSPLLIAFLPFLFFLLFSYLYIRTIFGFFSRLFEREADLGVFRLSLNPLVMIQALKDLALYNEIPLTQPNWHHFSIQERIEFLKKVINNPDLISQHHRKVKIALSFYVLFLLLLFSLFL